MASNFSAASEHHIIQLSRVSTRGEESSFLGSKHHMIQLSFVAALGEKIRLLVQSTT